MKPEELARTKIDELLTKAGWKVINLSEYQNQLGYFAIREYPTTSGPADYVLALDGQLIGAVEAKKYEYIDQAKPSAASVLTQALRYSADIDWPASNYGQYKLPFLYSSDGKTVSFQDLAEQPSFSRTVSGFHTPNALQELLKMNRQQDVFYKLRTVPVKEEYGGRELRYYQKNAVEFVVSQLLKGKRKTLVAMATGTGKTFMGSALIYHLIKQGMFKRVLFLVDRRSLSDQTVTALSTFEPEKGNKFDTIYPVYCDRIPTDEDSKDVKYNAKILQPSQLKNRSGANTFVYVSTIQRLYSMLKGKSYVEPSNDDEWNDGDDSPIEYNENFPIDSFDLIISDECHRSIYNKWKYVLDYFDSYQVGLTATPAMHTAAFFHASDPKDIFTYSYKQAVDDGFLVDFDAVRIQTDIDMSEEIVFAKGEAIKLMDKATLSKEDTILEDELKIDISSLERKVTVDDRNRKIVDEVLSYIEDGQKTIVFAVNEIHADKLVALFREKLNKGDDYVQKITYSVDKPNEQIRKFRNLDKPQIVVSVDMLSTGVDIPKVENLVIIRPIRSRILYEQVIGRGTRLCKDINKTNFTVFDAVGVIEFMKNNEAQVMLPTAKVGKTIGEVIYDIKANKHVEDNAQILARKLQRIDRNIADSARTQLEDFGIPDGDLMKFSDVVQDRLAQRDEQMIEMFSDPKLQEFLTNYPQIRAGFVISEEKTATVKTSEYIFRTKDGRELKPGDYLDSFKQYIKRNAHEIEALRILLESPRKFTIKDFNELKEQLAATPERYTEDRLQHAGELLQIAKSPADLYSYVSYAVWDTELMTPEERVNRAFKKMSVDTMTVEQQTWMQDIKSHLVTNIIVEPEDFKGLPFSRKGGWKKADDDFSNNLAGIIETINSNVLMSQND